MALPPPLVLLGLVLALAACAGTRAGASSGAGMGARVGAGAATVAPVPPPGGGHNSSSSGARPSWGRGFEKDIAAIFNKVAYGTTAAPTTTRLPGVILTTSTVVPSTTLPPPTTIRTPPPPVMGTDQPVLVPALPPVLPPAVPGSHGPGPTRRAPHPASDYAPPNRPPPLPAEYNPFANKAILRGSQSEAGSSPSTRKSPPQIVPPRAPPAELIPLRPINGPGGVDGGPVGNGDGDMEDAEGVLDIQEHFPDPPVHVGKHHHENNGHLHSEGTSAGSAGAAAAGLDPALKAAKPTELLEQVNKDSIIDVQAETAVVADPAIQRVPNVHSSDKVLVAPATSPPSASRPGEGWESSAADWRVAWCAQVYSLASMWGLLALLSLLAALRLKSRFRLLPRLYFVLLLALLLVMSAANSFNLFYEALSDSVIDSVDGIAAHSSRHAPGPGVTPAGVPQLLADLVLPFLPAAFSVFFFIVMRVNHVSCGSSRLQTPAFLAVLCLFLSSCVSLEVAASTMVNLSYLRLASRGLVVTASALLGLSYVCIFRPLRRAAAKKQAEQLRAAFTAFRRPPTQALPRIVTALLFSAIILLSLATVYLYRLIDVHLFKSDRDWRSPPWWYLRLGASVGELLVGFLLLWGATRGPSRTSEERSETPRSSRGGPGALSLVSCAGRRFLFDCPSTGSEENKNSEDNAYPTVCAPNHAILNYTQHSGNKVYDDSFPLANLHSVPLNSSGDDFSNVPTMPKRRPLAHKAGTLLPPTHYSKEKNSRRAGHHTLGPGGQLYQDDSLLRFDPRDHTNDTLKRGSRTTGRTRKTRHTRHRDDSYTNCPQDDYDQKLDGLADEFQVFKQYASTGSSESADNYDVPMLVNVTQPSNHIEGNKRHRRRPEDNRSLHRDRDRKNRHADSLSPASPSDLSDCDRLSSNRSSYDESAPMRPHHSHRGKALLRDREASEDDVTPDSAVVADITTSSHSPREKRGGKKATRRHMYQDSPSSPELHDRGYPESVWAPQ